MQATLRKLSIVQAGAVQGKVPVQAHLCFPGIITRTLSAFRPQLSLSKRPTSVGKGGLCITTPRCWKTLGKHLCIPQHKKLKGREMLSKAKRDFLSGLFPKSQHLMLLLLLYRGPIHCTTGKSRSRLFCLFPLSISLLLCRQSAIEKIPRYIETHFDCCFSWVFWHYA